MKLAEGQEHFCQLAFGLQESIVVERSPNGFSIKIGAGLGPMKGKIWRIGLMGATSTPENVKKVLGALKVCLGK